MLRTSLRAVADPLRSHICLSCIARRQIAPVPLRQFHRIPALRSEAIESKPELPNVIGNNGSDIPVPKTEEASKDVSQEQQSDGDNTNVEGGSPQADGRERSKGKARARERQRRSKKTKNAEEAKQQEGLQEFKPANESEGVKEDQSNAFGSGIKNSPGARLLNDLFNKQPTSTSTSTSTSTFTPTAQAPKERASKSSISHLSSFIKVKETGKIDLQNDKLEALDVPQPPVPGLAFGLDRVLFNPGVYQLRDPRSRVYNFDPYLGNIMPVTEFDFDTLKEYITSSRDETLRETAIKHGKKYAGSSSSMTTVLSQFHYLLSAWRGVDTRMISQGFPDKLRTFTRLLRAPAAMFLHYQDGTYAIDADKEFDSANILMNLGKSMEKMLTMPKEEYERYRRSHENKITAEEENAVPESYHFSTLGDFIMRSQLDAHDPRLPGTGMFDLKTRAVVSIRMDAQNFEHGLGYEIKDRCGEFESYEREYFDMIRAAFLKYSLQVRVGRMDGIFVAFHNIERIFGFQYISLPEMDQSLHGTSDTTLGDTEFQLSIKLWNEILDKVTARFPEQSLRLHFETRDAVTPFMYIFAEPVSKSQIQTIQSKNKDKIEAYQQRLLNLTPKEGDADLDAPMTDEAESPVTAPEETAEIEPVERSLFAMALSVKNFVNGKEVARPENLTASDEWTIEYELNEVSAKQGATLYKMCQTRRQKALDVRGEDEVDVAQNVYIRRLRNISKLGRKHREQENELDNEAGVVTYGEK
ncbi:mitochondrial translation protein [Penicillium malachiteum]|uniref:mitochondrial translation protein n=1 Tax=Penicillium malachiteum TaxID=1324776 RepID=UPI00254932C2|nr:mitochondrial translation protein [Penicillium malachiteum]KAJ5715105.1 mitochondrial translation protein [Penicillium malachiteum]